jgi:hypothetical protein
MTSRTSRSCRHLENLLADLLVAPGVSLQSAQKTKTMYRYYTCIIYGIKK